MRSARTSAGKATMEGAISIAVVVWLALTAVLSGGRKEISI